MAEAVLTHAARGLTLLRSRRGPRTSFVVNGVAQAADSADYRLGRNKRLVRGAVRRRTTKCHLQLRRQVRGTVPQVLP
jgi:hypothetical protein